MGSHSHQIPHFLLVTIAAQGQINPVRLLARRITQATSPAPYVTIATPVSSHRLIDDPHGMISYASYSDGFDEGFHPATGDLHHFNTQLTLVGTRTLSLLARSLAARGRPVTCVIYTLLTHWAADVATSLGVPSFPFWPQPASVLALFHHFFDPAAPHAGLIAAHRDDPSFVLTHLPGLPPFRINELPTLLTAPDDAISSNPLLDGYRSMMEGLRQPSPRVVLVNTFQALEADAIEALRSAHLDLIPVGPMIDKDNSIADGNVNNNKKDLFERDGSGYLEWLEGREPGSVVYLSFGSLARFSASQMEEMREGVKESGRDFLWVIRRDAYNVDDKFVEVIGSGGMVIEWCDQVRVLSQGAVGCFVTHCGWNSMTESIACGVPMVMVGGWLDQKVNAKLAEGWGVGVRAEVNEDGVVEGRELRRCLDVVMGEGERGVEIRRRAEFWKEKAAEAVADGGPSARNLLGFLSGVPC